MASTWAWTTSPRSKARSFARAVKLTQQPKNRQRRSQRLRKRLRSRPSTKQRLPRQRDRKPWQYRQPATRAEVEASSAPPTIRHSQLAPASVHRDQAPPCPSRHFLHRQRLYQFVFRRCPGDRARNHCPALMMRLAHSPSGIFRMMRSPPGRVHRFQDVRWTGLAATGLSDLATALRIAGLALGLGQSLDRPRLSRVVAVQTARPPRWLSPRPAPYATSSASADRHPTSARRPDSTRGGLPWPDPCRRSVNAGRVYFWR